MRNKLVRRAAVALSLAVSAGLVLTSCAAGFGGGENDRVRVAMMQPPKAALNPFSDDAFKLSRLSTGETLVRLNEDIEAEPLLATEWTTEDDKTWVFTLRDDVTFHDGAEFDAAAVKNMLDEATSASPVPRALNGVELTSVEATGDYEITIVTSEADPLLPNRLASPQLSVLSPAAYGDDGTISPVGTGTGPFELTAVGGSTTATLERFDDYWGDPAEAAGIDVSFVPDGTARAASLRSDEADVAETIPVSQISLLDEDMVNEVYMPRTTLLALNSESGPFADQAIRAAAREAIDSESIVDSVYEGYADPAEGLIGPAVPWAEELRGDVASTVEPGDGTGVEITLATYTDRSELPEIAVQLESQLEAAGFVVKQDVREYVNMEADMLEGNFDAVLLSRNTLIDTGDILSFIAQDFTCDGGYNAAQFCNKDVDAIINAGMQVPSGEERQVATMKAEEAILQRDAAVPIVHDRVVQGETGSFTDFVRDPLERRLITEHTKPAN